MLGANLLRAFTSSDELVELSAAPAAYTIQRGPTPVGSRWARRELTRTPTVTNLRHERVHLEPLEAELLRMLDGTRDEAELVRVLTPSVRSGDIVFARDGQPVTDGDEGVAMLPESVRERMKTLTRAALLEKQG